MEGQDKYGVRSYPAYYETLQRRAFEATKYCLELGLDINGVNDAGQTPLHGAVYMGGTLIAPHLVEQGAEMDVINLRGQTPWMVAAQGEYRAGSFYRHEETGRSARRRSAPTRRSASISAAASGRSSGWRIRRDGGVAGSAAHALSSCVVARSRDDRAFQAAGYGRITPHVPPRTPPGCGRPC